MSHTRPAHTFYLWSFVAGSAGLISLLFLPFAGFTELTRYVPSNIYRDYGVAGIGTYGQDFNIFGFPASVGTIQILMLLLAVMLISPLTRCWKWYRSPGDVPRRELMNAAMISGVVAGAYVSLVLLTLLVVFPSVEERTIWLVESSGWLEAWWPRYGAFVTAIGIGGMAVALGMRSRIDAAGPSDSGQASGEPPPSDPSPPPSEPDPPGPTPPPSA